MDWLAGKKGRISGEMAVGLSPKTERRGSHNAVLYVGGVSEGPAGLAHSYLGSLRGRGKYEFLSELGRGGSATVYKARRVSDQLMVAVKVIDLEEADSDLDHFRSEVSLLSQCKSPNVISYYDSLVLGSELWVVMEYLDGGSVVDHLSPAGLPEDAAAVILKSVLKGLDYLHKQSKLHRDVKCANILLSSSGEVKLADFGVAAQLQTISEKKLTFAGTPLWMAPEVIQKSSHNEKADIWSLGITAMEMVLGKPPLSDKPPLKVLFMIPSNPAPRLCEPFSKNIQSFVEKCLQKDATQRPSPSELLRHKFIKSGRKKRDLVAALVKKWQEHSKQQKRRASCSSVDRDLLLHGAAEPVLVDDEAWDFSEGSRRHSLQLSVSSRENDFGSVNRLLVQESIKQPQEETETASINVSVDEDDSGAASSEAHQPAIDPVGEALDPSSDGPQRDADIVTGKTGDENVESADRDEVSDPQEHWAFAKGAVNPAPMEASSSLSHDPGKWNDSTPTSPSSVHASMADPDDPAQVRRTNSHRSLDNMLSQHMAVTSDAGSNGTASPVRSRKAMSDVAPSRTLSPAKPGRAFSPDSFQGVDQPAGNKEPMGPQTASDVFDGMLSALGQALALQEDEEKRQTSLAALAQVEQGLQEVLHRDQKAVLDLFETRMPRGRWASPSAPGPSAPSVKPLAASSSARSLDGITRTISPTRSGGTGGMSDSEQHWSIMEAGNAPGENLVSEEEDRPSQPHHQGALTLFSDTDEEHGPVLTDSKVQAKMRKRSRGGKKGPTVQNAVIPNTKLTLSPLKLSGAAAKFVLARLDGVRSRAYSAIGMSSNIVGKGK